MLMIKKSKKKTVIPTLVLRQRYQKIASSIFNQIELVNWKSEVWKRHFYEYNFDTSKPKNLLIIVKKYYISALKL